MSAARYRLVIGNKNWSSWSLRPWLVMRYFGLAFDEINIQLRVADTAAAIHRLSPSGKVPALLDGSLLIWDSLAIIEHLADEHPEHPIWPKDRDARAIARAVSAEMHAGFQALRQNCPMDFLARGLAPADLAAIEPDVRRILALWLDCRQRYGSSGPFLFSTFTAADAMFAPVASRFRTYIPDLATYGDDGTAVAYIDAVFAMPQIKAWAVEARAEVARYGQPS